MICFSFMPARIPPAEIRPRRLSVWNGCILKSQEQSSPFRVRAWLPGLWGPTRCSVWKSRSLFFIRRNWEAEPKRNVLTFGADEFQLGLRAAEQRKTLCVPGGADTTLWPASLPLSRVQVAVASLGQQLPPTAPPRSRASGPAHSSQDPALSRLLAGPRIGPFPAHPLAVHHCKGPSPLVPEPVFAPNWARHHQAEARVRFSRHS